MPITHTPGLIEVNPVVRHSIIDKRLRGPMTLDIIFGGLHVDSRLYTWQLWEDDDLYLGKVYC